MTSETHAGARAQAAYEAGVALLRRGAAEEAAATLADALAEADTDLSADAALALAVAHRRRGDLRAAADAYARVAAERPDSGDAWLNLGAALADCGRLAAAIEPLRRAAALGVDSPQPLQALARVLNDLGRAVGAQAACEAGLRRWRDDPALLQGLARAWSLQGRPELAATVLQRALSTAPDDREVLLALARALQDDGRTDEALDILRGLVAHRPDDGLSRLLLCMTQLPPLYADAREVERRRSAYGEALAGLIDWASERPGALADAVGASQPFYLPYQGENDRALQVAYGGLVSRVMRAAVAEPPLPPPPAPGERIRIGFVSGFFRAHSNWRMPVEGWVRGLDRSRFRLFGYHTGAQTDAVTDQAAALFERFVQGPLPTTAWRDEIARDAPHVLIYPEIGMDPAAVRLAALRLARLQCNSWGHPVTSGLPTLDVFLSSEAMEPAGAQDAYSERLVRLPGLSTVLHRAGAPAAPAPRSTLGLPEDAPVLWCGQSPFKYHPARLDVLARIAERAPDAVFVFSAFPGSDRLTLAFRDKLRTAFDRRALRSSERIVLLPRLEPNRFDAALASADVVLDSLDWSGCNTLVTSLALGLPVVTTPGRFMRGRHGSALLSAIGLEHWIARDETAYVALASDLAQNHHLRARCVTEVQAARAQLYEAGSPTLSALETFLIRNVTPSDLRLLDSGGLGG